ncbi:thioredoxin reductase [Clohesyomyces aquaticus]|uniref:Thioredoxin reductase n=1 Tax=Clohesyomyces aquaticus TaxID=1231657 RepID=A0A1Y1ZWP7_9PLEO|nr:thioredoxin reductase [Clohesyomyces aquaticus]
MPPTTPIPDVLIIGGSHAGLSAALTLYRALHTSIIFDSHRPRNNYSTPVRLTATWEHEEPEKFKQASRKELEDAGYTTFVDTEITTVRKTDEGLFEVVSREGEKWVGRKLLFAIGSRDIFPQIPGYEALYTQRIFQCMLQFGYEERGCESAGLLAVEGLANVFFSTMLADDSNKFTDKVTIYTNQNPMLASDISVSLESSDIGIDDRKIKALREGEARTQVVIEFEDGSEVTEGFIVHRPNTELDRTLVDQLGLKISERGDIEAMPPFCQTSVPGVFAAGDCASPMKIIPNALCTGAYAGCGIARELPRRVTERKIVTENGNTRADTPVYS